MTLPQTLYQLSKLTWLKHFIIIWAQTFQRGKGAYAPIHSVDFVVEFIRVNLCPLLTNFRASPKMSIHRAFHFIRIAHPDDALIRGPLRPRRTPSRAPPMGQICCGSETTRKPLRFNISAVQQEALHTLCGTQNRPQTKCTSKILHDSARSAVDGTCRLSKVEAQDKWQRTADPACVQRPGSKSENQTRKGLPCRYAQKTTLRGPRAQKGGSFLA